MLWSSAYVTETISTTFIDIQNYYESMRFYFYGASLFRFAPNSLSGVQAGSPAGMFRRKLLMIMKVTSILLLVACLHVYGSGLTQKVTFTGKNVSVEQVFAAIEKQTGYVVFFDYASLGGVKNVSVSVKDASITDLLRECFEDKSVQFTMQGKSILISRKKPSVATMAAEFLPPPPTDIKGWVVDSLGNPLVGASVLVKGTKKGAHTDDKGNFLLQDAGGEIVLEISFTGYQTQTVKVGADRSRSTYVILKASSNPLDETIVQAYGTTTRRFNVGSIAKVSREEIQSQPVFNVLSALEGRVPGLLVTTQSGIPGAMVKVQIRGQNSIGATARVNNTLVPDNPLFFIDGVPFAPQNTDFSQLQTAANSLTGLAGGGLSPFNNINPADIESIEVLKDADATAIYGARGANGVILITTRKANLGKASLSGSVNAGFSRITRGMPLMTTEQYLAMRREGFKNDNITPNTTQNSTGFAPDLLLFDQNRNVDFLKDWFGRTSSMYSANLFFSGGSANNSFSIGGGYDRQGNSFQGDFKNDRFSVNSRVHHGSVDRRFTADFSTSYSYSRNNLPGSPLMSSAFTLAPNFPDLLDANGNLVWALNGTPYSTFFNAFANPFSYLKQTSDVNTHNLMLNMNLSYRLLPGLTLRSNMGYNLFMDNEYKKTPIASLDPYGFTKTGNAAKANSSVYTWNIEPQLNYVRRFGKGKLDVLAGTTFQKQMNNSVSLNGNNYLNDLLLNSINAAGAITVSENVAQYKYNALFGRINYVHNEKYILNVTGRTDGSSRFINGRGWAQFAAVGTGWLFSEEAFMKAAKSVISFGKLRGSYGTTGSDNVGDYMWYSNWIPNGANYSYGGQNGYYPGNLNNPDYSWSSTRKLEVGMDLGLFSDKVLLGVAWFRNRSSNQLVQYQLPTQTGFPNVTKNFQAEVQNAGWEITATVNVLKKKDFNWKSNFNISFSRNKLIAFPGLESSSYGLYYTIGMSTSTVRGYKYAGINDATGVYQFMTAKGAIVDRPSAFDGDNRFLLGNVDPKYYGGWRNTFSYKGWQLDMFVEFRKQWGPNFLNSINGTPGGVYNMPTEFLDRWTGSGGNAAYQKFSSQSFGTGAASGQTLVKMSDFAYGDASYIRFKTLSLSYRVNPSFLKRIKMTSCNVFVNAQNLFVITGYKGHDPETQNYYSLPPLKTVSTGLQFNF